MLVMALTIFVSSAKDPAFEYFKEFGSSLIIAINNNGASLYPVGLHFQL